MTTEAQKKPELVTKRLSKHSSGLLGQQKVWLPLHIFLDPSPYNEMLQPPALS